MICAYQSTEVTPVYKSSESVRRYLQVFWTYHTFRTIQSSHLSTTVAAGHFSTEMLAEVLDKSLETYEQKTQSIKHVVSLCSTRVGCRQ